MVRRPPTAVVVARAAIPVAILVAIQVKTLAAVATTTGLTETKGWG
jgi:hypothetical protein